MRRWIPLLAVAIVPSLSFPEPTGQVVGYYSDGSLRGAAALRMDGPGYVHYHVERNRHYGSDGLISMLESIAGMLHETYPDGERLQIGDIAAEHGGPVSGHSSHQNGLDADMVYFRRDHQEAWQTGDRFVTPKGELSENFDLARNYRLVRLLVATGRVNRIFVDPVIKHGLCKYAESLGELAVHAETLRRLRPYPEHQDHLHVRLTCPPTSARCKPQPEVAPGDGCDHLDWNAEEHGEE